MLMESVENPILTSDFERDDTSGKSLQPAKVNAASVTQETIRTITCPALPTEILFAIFRVHAETIDGSGLSPAENPDWWQASRTLQNCCLVCRHWGAVAREVLYRATIRIWRISPLEVLLRTVVEDPDRGKMLSDLIITNIHRTRDPRWRTFGKRTADLLCACPNIRTLRIRSHCLIMDPEVHHPALSLLTELIIKDHTFFYIRSIFPACPNLKTLHLRAVKGYLAEEVSSDVFSLLVSPPTFNLKELGVFETHLQVAHWSWLLSGCTNIKVLRLSGPSDSLRGVIELVAGGVVDLYLSELCDTPHFEDLQSTAQLLPAFTSLQSMRILGLSFPWEEVMRSLTSPLTNLAIDFSRGGCRQLSYILADSNWLPTLRAITIHLNSDVLSRGLTILDLRRIKDGFAPAVRQRNIYIKWKVENYGPSHSVTSWDEYLLLKYFGYDVATIPRVQRKTAIRAADC